MTTVYSTGYPPTPEHDKLRRHKPDHHAIEAFLRWLSEDRAESVCNPVRWCRCNHCTVCGEHPSEDGPCTCDCAWGSQAHQPVSEHEIAHLIAAFFGVDPVAFENEKRAMLEYIRNQHIPKIVKVATP